MDAKLSISRKLVVGAVGALTISVLLPVSASAAGSSTTVPISNFTVASSQCAGPNLPLEIALWQSISTVVAQNPIGSICTPLPLSNTSVTISSSPSGSATISAQAQGNVLIGEAAYGRVDLTTSVPLSSPSSSVEISIPYTTAGVRASTPPSNQVCGASFSLPCDDPQADVAFGAPFPEKPQCADNSNAFEVPTPAGLDSPTAPGSGTVTVRIYCPDGADLVTANLEVTVFAGTSSDTGQAETAFSDFEMHSVTATVTN